MIFAYGSLGRSSLLKQPNRLVSSAIVALTALLDYCFRISEHFAPL